MGEKAYKTYGIYPQMRGYVVECNYSTDRSPDHPSYQYSKTESCSDSFAFSTMKEVSEFLGEEDRRRP